MDNMNITELRNNITELASNVSEFASNISDLTSNITETTIEPIERFGLAFCHLVDFPDDDLTDCSIIDPTKCVRCGYRGTFFTGESIDDDNSFALQYYYVLWILVILVSVLAILGNIIIFIVLKKRSSTASFDFLLQMLAVFGTFCSIMSIFAATGSTYYFGNWCGRGKGSLYFYVLSLFTAFFGRSGSTFTTVLITIERYLMIAFPIKANNWFTTRNTKLLSALVLLMAILVNYPRYASVNVEENNLRDIPSIAHLEYVIRPTAQAKFWYHTMGAVHSMIDYWFPLPIILLFNLLSYIKVRELSKRRKAMNLKVKGDIRAIRMFLPVVVVYFLTNIEPIVNYIIIHFTKVAYRELYMLLFLSIAVNSVVNMPIYYYCSQTFKSEVQAIVRNYIGGDKGKSTLDHHHEEKPQIVVGYTGYSGSDSGLGLPETPRSGGGVEFTALFQNSTFV